MSDPIQDVISDWARERPELDAGAMGVVGRVLRLAKLWEQRLVRLLKEHRLGAGEFDVLATLRRQGGECELSPSQLAQAAMLTTGGTTNLLDRLQKRGWVARRPNPADRRGTFVRLTDAGRELVDELIGPRLADADECLEALNAKEQARLAKLLAKLLKSGSD